MIFFLASLTKIISYIFKVAGWIIVGAHVFPTICETSYETSTIGFQEA